MLRSAFEGAEVTSQEATTPQETSPEENITTEHEARVTITDESFDSPDKSINSPTSHLTTAFDISPPTINEMPTSETTITEASSNYQLCSTEKRRMLKIKRNELVMVGQGLVNDNHVAECLKAGIYTETDLAKTTEATTKMTAAQLKSNLSEEIDAEYVNWNEDRIEENAAKKRIKMQQEKENKRAQQLEDKRMIQEASKSRNKKEQPKKSKRKENKNKIKIKNPIGKNETNDCSRKAIIEH